ncbi:MAG TPA: response regulator transcription factor [Nocardioides sp.]|nr:response regulator transcription factor [Nocardioides sp.]
MPTASSIRVYLVDDHEIVRRGIASLIASLADDIEVVGQAATASVALPDILRLRPDVVVLDAQLPDGTGIDLCREMRSHNPDIRGLILTSYDSEDSVSSAILAGASGYVLKQIDGTNLVSGIRLIAAGHSLIDPVMAARVQQQVEFHKSTLELISELTPRQTKILFLIGEGLTNRQIGERLFLAEKTVKNHVTGLLSRLGVETRMQAALLANRVRNENRAAPVPQRDLRPASVDIVLPARRRTAAG